MIFAGLFASCEDDLRFDVPGEIPEGNATIETDVEFMALSDALVSGQSRATVAPPGDAMNEIDDLCLLFYDKDGKLSRVYSHEDFIDYELIKPDPDRDDADAENGSTAESHTRRAHVKLDVPFGEYYIYAVANLGQYANTTTRATTTLDVLKSDEVSKLIQTRDGLKQIKCEWDASNYRNNREMIGFFTDPSASTESAEASARDNSRIVGEPLVRIVTDNMYIHAWMKRVASKVTIDFDGSNLRDNVVIYIRRATIHHIPVSASLGLESKVADESGYIMDSSHHLDYGEGEDYENWPSLTRNRYSITKVADGCTVPSHSQDSKALYFYENCQGNYEGDDRYDKRQTPSVAETVKDKENGFDLLPCGTYIEVEGYYVATSTTNPTQGPVKYRFMLGQDVKFDYQALRNCHYKVTMKFRGNANDVDWHIEYEEENPQMFAPDRYYIAYLYGRRMTMPVRINEGENYNLESLTSEIICNHWAPEDPYRNIRKLYPSSDEYEFTWNVYYYNTNSRCEAPSLTHTYEGVSITDEYNPDTEPFDFNKDIEFGFLSLRRVREQVTGGSTQNPQDIIDIYKKRNIGNRSYEFPANDGVYTYDAGNLDYDHPTGEYTVQRNGRAYVFNMPFYTRGRQLSEYLAYTANNPYGYPRKAVVRIVAKFKHKINGQVLYRSKRVTIQQVERIQNPKGIYRSHNNDKPFDVHLMISDPENLDRFIEVISDGPWRAEVVGDNSTWVLLNGGTKTVYGESGTPIRFRVQPSGTIGAERVRNAAVRIYYNNYTCVHLIILRQGYAPVAIPGNAVYIGSTGKDYDGSNVNWATFNLYNGKQFMSSPIACGSYFKLGNFDDAICESNNNRYKLGRNVASNQMVLAGQATTKSWNDIKNKDQNNNELKFYCGRDNKGGLSSSANIKLDVDYWGPLNINGQTYRVATYEDFAYLDANTEKSYGVVYADGATETATDTETAYRFLDTTGNCDESPRGMRGLVCYAWNTETGRGNFEQVFFPISGSGHGRRKQWLSEGSDRGVLRYGDVKYTLVPPRIQVFDLNQTPGAMYWIRQGVHSGRVEAGVKYASFSRDINYYTYAFGTYHDFCIGLSGDRAGSDALLVKMVLTNE